MRRSLLIAFLISLLSASVAAAQAPGITSLRPAETTTERADRRADLFAALKSAASDGEAQAAEDAIWRFWFEAPTSEIGGLMERAVELRSVYAYQDAREVLDDVVAADPDYPEGWNQRAFILFLQEKYDESLADIDRTLELEPDHFGALAGQVQIFLRQGRIKLARSALRNAARANPWIAKRWAHPMLEAPGEDI